MLVQSAPTHPAAQPQITELALADALAHYRQTHLLWSLSQSYWTLHAFIIVCGLRK
jgi:hypothetical protein